MVICSFMTFFFFLSIPRKLKRKSTQEYGVSSSTVEEAHDIFGDPNEYLNRRKKSLARIDQFDNSGRQMEGSLKNVYEPFILTEKYLTEKDDLIRNIDMPERIQVNFFHLCGLIDVKFVPSKSHN